MTSPLNINSQQQFAAANIGTNAEGSQAEGVDPEAIAIMNLADPPLPAAFPFPLGVAEATTVQNLDQTIGGSGGAGGGSLTIGNIGRSVFFNNSNMGGGLSSTLNGRRRERSALLVPASRHHNSGGGGEKRQGSSSAVVIMTSINAPQTSSAAPTAPATRTDVNRNGPLPTSMTAPSEPMPTDATSVPTTVVDTTVVDTAMLLPLPQVHKVPSAIARPIRRDVANPEQGREEGAARGNAPAQQQQHFANNAAAHRRASSRGRGGGEEGGDGIDEFDTAVRPRLNFAPWPFGFSCFRYKSIAMEHRFMHFYYSEGKSLTFLGVVVVWMIVWLVALFHMPSHGLIVSFAIMGTGLLCCVFELCLNWYWRGHRGVGRKKRKVYQAVRQPNTSESSSNRVMAADATTTAAVQANHQRDGSPQSPARVPSAIIGRRSPSWLSRGGVAGGYASDSVPSTATQSFAQQQQLASPSSLLSPVPSNFDSKMTKATTKQRSIASRIRHCLRRVAFSKRAFLQVLKRLFALRSNRLRVEAFYDMYLEVREVRESEAEHSMAADAAAQTIAAAGNTAALSCPATQTNGHHQQRDGGVEVDNTAASRRKGDGQKRNGVKRKKDADDRSNKKGQPAPSAAEAPSSPLQRVLAASKHLGKSIATMQKRTSRLVFMKKNTSKIVQGAGGDKGGDGRSEGGGKRAHFESDAAVGEAKPRKGEKKEGGEDDEEEDEDETHPTKSSYGVNNKKLLPMFAVWCYELNATLFMVALAAIFSTQVTFLISCDDSTQHYFSPFVRYVVRIEDVEMFCRWSIGSHLLPPISFCLLTGRPKHWVSLLVIALSALASIIFTVATNDRYSDIKPRELYQASQNMLVVLMAIVSAAGFRQLLERAQRQRFEQQTIRQLKVWWLLEEKRALKRYVDALLPPSVRSRLIHGKVLAGVGATPAHISTAADGHGGGGVGGRGGDEAGGALTLVPSKDTMIRKSRGDGESGSPTLSRAVTDNAPFGSDPFGSSSEDSSGGGGSSNATASSSARRHGWPSKQRRGGKATDSNAVGGGGGGGLSSGPEGEGGGGARRTLSSGAIAHPRPVFESLGKRNAILDSTPCGTVTVIDIYDFVPYCQRLMPGDSIIVVAMLHAELRSAAAKCKLDHSITHGDTFITVSNLLHKQDLHAALSVKFVHEVFAALYPQQQAEQQQQAQLQLQQQQQQQQLAAQYVPLIDFNNPALILDGGIALYYDQFGQLVDANGNPVVISYADDGSAGGGGGGAAAAGGGERAAMGGRDAAAAAEAAGAEGVYGGLTAVAQHAMVGGDGEGQQFTAYDLAAYADHHAPPPPQSPPTFQPPPPPPPPPPSRFPEMPQVRVAMHSGAISGGVVGQSQLRYSVFGPTLWVATDHLLGLCGADECFVMLSETTITCLGTAARVHDASPIALEIEPCLMPSKSLLLPRVSPTPPPPPPAPQLQQQLHDGGEVAEASNGDHNSHATVGTADTTAGLGFNQVQVDDAILYVFTCVELFENEAIDAIINGGGGGDNHHHRHHHHHQRGGPHHLGNGGDDGNNSMASVVSSVVVMDANADDIASSTSSSSPSSSSSSDSSDDEGGNFCQGTRTKKQAVGGRGKPSRRKLPRQRKAFVFPRREGAEEEVIITETEITAARRGEELHHSHHERHEHHHHDHHQMGEGGEAEDDAVAIAKELKAMQEDAIVPEQVSPELTAKILTRQREIALRQTGGRWWLWYADNRFYNEQINSAFAVYHYAHSRYYAHIMSNVLAFCLILFCLVIVLAETGGLYDVLRGSESVYVWDCADETAAAGAGRPDGKCPFDSPYGNALMKGLSGCLFLASLALCVASLVIQILVRATVSHRLALLSGLPPSMNVVQGGGGAGGGSKSSSHHQDEKRHLNKNSTPTKKNPHQNAANNDGIGVSAFATPVDGSHRHAPAAGQSFPAGGSGSASVPSPSSPVATARKVLKPLRRFGRRVRGALLEWTAPHRHFPHFEVALSHDFSDVFGPVFRTAILIDRFVLPYLIVCLALFAGSFSHPSIIGNSPIFILEVMVVYMLFSPAPAWAAVFNYLLIFMMYLLSVGLVHGVSRWAFIITNLACVVTAAIVSLATANQSMTAFAQFLSLALHKDALYAHGQVRRAVLAATVPAPLREEFAKLRNAISGERLFRGEAAIGTILVQDMVLVELKTNVLRSRTMATALGAGNDEATAVSVTLLSFCQRQIEKALAIANKRTSEVLTQYRREKILKRMKERGELGPTGGEVSDAVALQSIVVPPPSKTHWLTTIRLVGDTATIAGPIASDEPQSQREEVTLCLIVFLRTLSILQKETRRGGGVGARSSSSPTGGRQRRGGGGGVPNHAASASLRSLRSATQAGEGGVASPLLGSVFEAFAETGSNGGAVVSDGAVAGGGLIGIGAVGGSSSVFYDDAASADTQPPFANNGTPDGRAVAAAVDTPPSLHNQPVSGAEAALLANRSQNNNPPSYHTQRQQQQQQQQLRTTATTARHQQTQATLTARAVTRRHPITYTAAAVCDLGLTVMHNSLYPSFDVSGNAAYKGSLLLAAAPEGAIVVTEALAKIYCFSKLVALATRMEADRVAGLRNLLSRRHKSAAKGKPPPQPALISSSRSVARAVDLHPPPLSLKAIEEGPSSPTNPTLTHNTVNAPAALPPMGVSLEDGTATTTYMSGGGGATPGFGTTPEIDPAAMHADAVLGALAPPAAQQCSSRNMNANVVSSSSPLSSPSAGQQPLPHTRHAHTRHGEGGSPTQRAVVGGGNGGDGRGPMPNGADAIFEPPCVWRVKGLGSVVVHHMKR